MPKKPSLKTIKPKSSPKGKISVDAELCKGCQYCILSCPKEVISLSDEFNKAGFFPALPSSPEKCTGCALCAEICPEIAITVWKNPALGL